MRNPDNIEALLQLPIDWMGLIFYAKSKRNVPNSAAKEILTASEGKVKRVGVFVNESIETVIQKVAKFKLSLVQLHGKESPDYCYDLLAKSAKTFGCGDELQIIKAFSVDENFDFSVTNTYEPFVNYFLFDTKGKLPGGNGYTFDWSLLNDYPSKKPFFLSGGIGLESMEKLKDFLKSPASKYCHAIDVNSKFETKPGLKKTEALRAFKTQLIENRLIKTDNRS